VKVTYLLNASLRLAVTPPTSCGVIAPLHCGRCHIMLEGTITMIRKSVNYEPAIELKMIARTSATDNTRPGIPIKNRYVVRRMVQANTRQAHRCLLNEQSEYFRSFSSSQQSSRNLVLSSRSGTKGFTCYALTKTNRKCQLTIT
jgi:hypothetical protein